MSNTRYKIIVLFFILMFFCGNAVGVENDPKENPSPKSIPVKEGVDKKSPPVNNGQVKTDKSEDAQAKTDTDDSGHSEVTEPGPPDMESFDKGYKYFSKEKYEKAAPYFYDYISKNSSDVQDYEWAEFFLGISLKKSGFSHASVDILSGLVTRKPNTKIVTYILELFEEITRTIPYDREQVVLKAVCDQDYAFVDTHLTDFINYHQGLFDWKNGFDEWGDNHFKKIREGSYYYFKFQYQKALFEILRENIDKAIEILNEIEIAKFDGEDLKNEVRKTLARLMYEKKEYAKADELYESISKNIVFQAQNLLERSWVHYRLKNQEKAMGLLYAFKAPVYRNYFTPEYFLLKSFIYKDVCHYQRALNVIDEFRTHYKDSLVNIYDRKEIPDNHALLLALIGKKKINQVWQFLLLLEEEKKKIDTFDDPGLKAHLEKIYSLQIQESTKALQLIVEEKFEEIANDLLEYEEKADLMAYEIGLDMYQRVYESHYEEDGGSKEKSKKQFEKHYYAFFPFQGEFWSDELKTYKVALEDKCSCMDEWDIFFK